MCHIEICTLSSCYPSVCGCASLMGSHRLNLSLGDDFHILWFSPCRLPSSGIVVVSLDFDRKSCYIFIIKENIICLSCFKFYNDVHRSTPRCIPFLLLFSFPPTAPHHLFLGVQVMTGGIPVVELRNLGVAFPAEAFQVGASLGATKCKWQT